MNRNSLLSIGVALIAMAAGPAATSALASTVTFGSPEKNGVDILNYDNGGNDSYPNDGLGPNDGVVFSGNGESLLNAASGGTGKFENNPSGTNGVLYFAYSSTTTPYMNVAAGFTALSFDYSLLNNSVSYSGTATLWSGLNGTGTVLATLSLTPSATPVSCSSSKDEFCTWSLVSAQNFGGVAESVTFGTNATVPYSEFDEIQVFATPLPASFGMLLAGLGILTAFGWRQRQARW